MSIPVFLSYPKPYKKNQEKFVEKLCSYLRNRGLEPRTLGVTDYDMKAPLAGIRRLMFESNGILTIAFRRGLIEKGVVKPDSDMGQEKVIVDGKWMTSPFCHIEPAMAFQLGLPVLVFREKDVLDDGILEKGVLGLYMPEFDLDLSIDEYFRSEEFRQLLGSWEGHVRCVYERKGMPGSWLY